MNLCQVPVKKRNIGIEPCGKKCVVGAKYCSRHKKEHLNDEIDNLNKTDVIHDKNDNIEIPIPKNIDLKLDENEEKTDYAKSILNELSENVDNENKFFEILERELKKLEIDI